MDFGNNTLSPAETADVDAFHFEAEQAVADISVHYENAPQMVRHDF